MPIEILAHQAHKLSVNKVPKTTAPTVYTMNQRGFEHELHAFELTHTPLHKLHTVIFNKPIENSHPLSAQQKLLAFLTPSEPVGTISPKKNAAE